MCVSVLMHLITFVGSRQPHRSVFPHRGEMEIITMFRKNVCE